MWIFSILIIALVMMKKKIHSVQESFLYYQAQFMQPRFGLSSGRQRHRFNWWTSWTLMDGRRPGKVAEIVLLVTGSREPSLRKDPTLLWWWMALLSFPPPLASYMLYAKVMLLIKLIRNGNLKFQQSVKLDR